LANSERNMERNSFHVLGLFIIVIIVGCSSDLSKFLSLINKELIEQKLSFGEDFQITNLLYHFPKKVKDTTNLKFTSFPPSCPPTYECIAQYGEIYLITKLGEHKQKDVLEYVYQTYYLKDKNFLINQSDFKDEKSPIDDFNISYTDKYPIPYFEKLDFNLGTKNEVLTINGDTLNRDIHKVPLDLEVFVIDAKPGNFWKVDCNEDRPKSLKEWKHGFSKGYATSIEEDLIVYWTLVW
jgi:hypothetical protein